MPSLSTALSLLAVLSACIGVVLTAWRTRQRCATFVDLLTSVAVTTLCVALGVQILPRMVSRVVSGFGTFHAVYLGMTLALPIVGAGVAVVALRRGSGNAPLVGCTALVLLAPLGWYMTHIEPSWLRVDTIDVPIDPARAGSSERDSNSGTADDGQGDGDSDGDGVVRIAVLADLQTARVGSHERAAVRSTMDGEPDLIVIPGDLYQPRADPAETDLAGVRDLLRTLHAPYGVYFTQGDHEDPALMSRLLEGSNITVLDDEVVALSVHGRDLLLGGTTIDVGSEGADRVRSRLLEEPVDGATTVLVSHRPDTALRLPDDSRVDLTIAGHTHGGQVVVPGFGPPMTLSEVPRTVARGGLHTMHGNTIYVSPGVGLERGDAPQLRLFNRPAVALLDLEQ